MGRAIAPLGFALGTFGRSQQEMTSSAYYLLGQWSNPSGMQ
jgi:hypothetical protein